MRVWKLLFWCFGFSACADVNTTPSDGSLDDTVDSGATNDASSSATEDASAIEDAEVTDVVDWGQLDSEEIATEAAAEEIAALECGAFDICGGDPSGTWRVDGLCVTNALDVATQSLQNCPGILAAYERTASGTIGFLSDGVMEIDFTITGMQHLVLDHVCTQRLYRKDASDELCAVYEEQLTGGASSTRTVACTFDDGACRCDVRTESSLAFTGTYSVEGNAIDDGATQVPFCIDGDTLSILYGGGVRSTVLTFTRM